MKTFLYFIRHAHSVYTPDELNRPLSERGKRDAERITDKLKKEKIEVVCSSPYRRAIQTVEGLVVDKDKEIILLDGLKERLLSTKPVEDFDSAICKVWKCPSFAFQGGESNLLAQKRGVSATFSLLNTYRGKRVAVGTHGNLMVLVLNHFDKRFDYDFWKNLEMPDVYRLTFDHERLVDVEKPVY
ncbi:histidine phosphatase family protein [Rossellomorea aquimaris]|uniref:histidine phosphatase family protein n=1 Tax=Rossellomorea aquimaris TaxID=189382 RepID=UPI0005CB6F0A|nr:histidine phosphatase family protein [Rossellomorea aquimaris]